MTIFLFIRHGEADHLIKGVLVGSTPGIHLTQSGRKQADNLANALLKVPIKGIYCSHLERAVETAYPLSKNKEVAIEIDSRLRDTDVGEWAGRKLKDLRKKNTWKQIQESPSTFSFPGGESFISIQKRVRDAIEAIASRHELNDIVAIFSHADPIKLVIAHYLGLPVDHFQRLSIDTASISVVIISNKGNRLAAINLQASSLPDQLMSLKVSESL